MEQTAAHSEPTATAQSFDELWANEPEATPEAWKPRPTDAEVSNDPSLGLDPDEGLEPVAEVAAESVDAAADATDPDEAVAGEDPTDAWEPETTVELGDNAEPVATAQAAEPVATEPAPVLSPEDHFTARQEAATEHYVTCSIARARLEAALKVAKKREKDALENLSEIIDRGVEPAPLFDPKPNRQEATDVAPDAGRRPILPPGCTSTTTPAGIAIHDPECNGTAPPTGDANAWKSACISKLQLKPALQEKLIEAGITTIGELEAFRAKVGDRREDWPKGIGEAKITAIEDAVVNWLTKNRDSQLFSSEGGGVESRSVDAEESSTYPDLGQWYEMTEEQQTAWLNERAVQLDSDDVDVLANRVAEGCDDFFTDGCEASEAGDLIANCEHQPGLECDAWILGWLWQGKQEGGEE
jgi:hypothetical protein